MEPQLVARVGYNHGKIKGYSEGDLKGGALRFGLGASVMHIPGSRKRPEGRSGFRSQGPWFGCHGRFLL